ncbi:FOG: PKD repeat [Nocardioides sp. J9]|uniref:PKD domain-containing protein n=1 Tax=Nocardioides sp. J9 TaxID=935844 RepID=UPI0011A7249B|nr:PKD domain-containing protein [Nocardioides sp. J9]TWG92495.1 FOG: PKD repeat [Nocardioides sp. J9]
MRRRFVSSRVALIVLAVVAALLAGVGAGSPATAQPARHRLLPSAVPAVTPHVLDGRVHALAEIGRKVYVGGTFTLTRNAGTSAQLATPYLFAFDRETGLVDPAFQPGLDANVTALAPSADGSALYVAGTFKNAGGTKVRNIIKVDAATGALVTAFKNPSPNGGVLDIELVGDRLLLAGTFTTVWAQPRPGLASLDATTGALDDYLQVAVSTNHNWPSGTAKAPVGVGKIAATLDGTKLVAIGNFKKADGLDRDQAMVIRLGETGASVDPSWRTLRYTPACSKNSFDSYVRDVDVSPDGSYFVIVSSGAGYNGTLCDTAARFDLAVTGQDVQPTWQAASGQDSLLSVAVADNAVYVGGHQKWMNAIQSGADEQAGQVPRPGLAALDPDNGLPLSWNPGRHPRGVGAEALLATDHGLYVGSDTEYVGNREHLRPRLAYFPIEGGTAPYAEADATLPRSLFRLSGTSVTTRTFTGSSITPASAVATSGAGSWSNVRGAFMVGSKLVYGWTDNQLHYRTFDGTTFGPDRVINPYVDPLWSTVTTSGGSQTYRGRAPTFYGQISGLTGLTYADHRIYYTRSGQSRVYWRWFSPESLVVGAAEFTVPSSIFPSLRDVRNLVHADGRLWAGMSTNQLYSLPVSDGAATGSWTRVTGSGIDTNPVWSSGTTFLGPVANQAPTAAFTSSCTGQACTFDATGSSDPDGTVTSYAWDLGDGTAATGSQPSRVYAAPGTYDVTLTVTDEDGGTGTVTQPVVIEGVESDVSYRDATGKVTNGTSIVSPVPVTAEEGDGLLAVVSASTTAVPAAPAGWTQVGNPVQADAMTTVVWQAVAGSADTTATATHRSPVVDTAGGWVVTVWADRSGATTAFTEPAGSSVRQRLIGTGGGHVDQLVVDTGGPVAAGAYGDQVATADAAAKGTSLTIALH